MKKLGNRFSEINIVTLTRLTREQRRLLEQFAQLEEKQRERSFGSKVKDIFG